LVTVVALSTGAITTITAIDGFAQNKISRLDQLIKDGMINNVTASNSLKYNNPTAQSQSGGDSTPDAGPISTIP
jgi:hypothetical protein